jgi:1-acyl-sn-glycerol-3-phosphate acyltransferase
LFQVPLLGRWLTYLGGIPVDRSGAQGYVNQLALDIGKSQECWIVFAPEGTRKKTPGWRTGFYRLAVSSGLPIGLAILDFKNKKIGIPSFIYPTGNEEEDLNAMRAVYAECGGFKPSNASPIKFWSPGT